jgi:hypothetical protein
MSIGVENAKCVMSLPGPGKWFSLELTFQKIPGKRLGNTQSDKGIQDRVTKKSKILCEKKSRAM